MRAAVVFPNELNYVATSSVATGDDMGLPNEVFAYQFSDKVKGHPGVKRAMMSLYKVVGTDPEGELVLLELPASSTVFYRAMDQLNARAVQNQEGMKASTLQYPFVRDIFSEKNFEVGRDRTIRPIISHEEPIADENTALVLATNEAASVYNRKPALV